MESIQGIEEDRGPSGGRGVSRIGWRDEVLLGWAVRFPVFTHSGLAERFGLHRPAVSRSVKRWRELGLCQQVESAALRWPVEQVLPAAGDVIGCSVPARRPSAGLAAHSLALLDVVSAAERAGWRTMTERDVAHDVGQQLAFDDVPTEAVMTERSARLDALFEDDDAPAQTPVRADRVWWTVPIPGSDGRIVDHRPDAVFRRGDATVAVEVELSHKAKPRLQRILDGYGRSRTYSHVVYLVPAPADVARINRINRIDRANLRCRGLVVDVAIDWSRPLASVPT